MLGMFDATWRVLLRVDIPAISFNLLLSLLIVAYTALTALCSTGRSDRISANHHVH